MAKTTVKYKEPAGYFTPGMLKAAEEWEKKEAAKQKAEKSAGKKKK